MKICFRKKKDRKKNEKKRPAAISEASSCFSFSPIWVKNCRSKKGIKQCLGGLKCSQNTKKNKKTLKVSFKAIFNVHFADLVSKEYFSIQRLMFIAWTSEKASKVHKLLSQSWPWC